jgi:hypothetical protein
MAPKVTQGFYEAIKVIKPDKVFTVAQVEESYPIGDGIIVVNLNTLLEELKA